MLALALLCIAGTASATPAVSFSPASLNLAPGETAQVQLILNEAPGGLAGYECTLVTPSSVASVTDASFPSWASLNRKTPGTGSYAISGVDLNKQVQAGLTNIVLATLTVRGNSRGSASIGITGLKMNADGGDEISPSTSALAVTVSGDATTTTTTTSTATATTTTTATGTTTATTTATTAATTAPVVTATTGVMPGSPIAGFTATPSAGNAPLKIQFYDRSTGTPTSYEWDFGDGGTSMIQNPSYTYYNEGLYTVKLKATNSRGSTSVVQKDYVAVGEKYMQMQPKPTPLSTITGSDLPAPTAERTAAVTTRDVTQKPATTTGKAAGDILAPVVGVLIAGLISVLVMTGKRY